MSEHSSTTIPAADVRRAPLDQVGAATLDLFESHDGYSKLIWECLSRFGEPGGRVLEIGCGIGTFSRMLLASPAVTTLHSVDIDAGYVERLSREIDDPRFAVFCSPAESFEPPSPPYDLAFSSNVFEHIEDDLAAMRVVERALAPGGEFRILVPAHPRLYCGLDEGLSHFRRYTRRSLSRLATDAGLVPEKVVFFNPIGALGWWFTGKVLRRKALPAGQVSFYDRFGLAISRLADRLNPIPFGVSVVARLRKPQ